MADTIPAETNRRTAGDVTRDILRGLFDVMLANEAGTREGPDPTFLHDFRVALRRIRSAISRLPGVLPLDVRERFGGEFKWLGAVTSPTRDYDVFLELLPAYESALGLEPGGEADLTEFGTRLRLRRDEEHAAMVEQLNSARYAELKEAWEGFLDSDPAGWQAPDASRPALDVASQEIWRSYEGSLERAVAIGEESPDEDFHELRKDLKKLRYLLEFFRELYPLEEIDGSIAALKTLQDVLGEINDLAVQQQIVRELGSGQRLLPYLEARLRQQRDSFPAAFEEFGSEAVDRRIRELFLDSIS
jgi:CHAD domain-containing protein